VPNKHTKQLHSKNSAQFYVVMPIHAAPAISACHKRPFAYIRPPNGQTAEDRAKPSPPSRSPLNLSPDRQFPWPNGLSRRTRLSHEILPSSSQGVGGCTSTSGCNGNGEQPDGPWTTAGAPVANPLAPWPLALTHLGKRHTPRPATPRTGYYLLYWLLAMALWLSSGYDGGWRMAEDGGRRPRPRAGAGARCHWH
jgi:hypothetical protein